MRLSSLVVAAVAAVAVLSHACGCAARSVPITDGNLFFSPYNWHVQEALGGAVTAQSNSPGAYLKTAFTGSSFALVLNTSWTPSSPYMTVVWSIDNGDWQQHVLGSQSSLDDQVRLQLASGLSTSSGPHTLWFQMKNALGSVDRWVVPKSVVRLASVEIDDNASLSAYPGLFSKRMLVYYGSVGEGVKINGESSGGDLSDNDSLRNWIQVLAQSLQAEVGAVCFGGMGYLSDGSLHALMDPSSDENSHSWSRYDQHSSRLDGQGLLQPPPDFVVNGLGNNDRSWPAATITAAAQAWLGAITAAAPQADVFLSTPFGLQVAQQLLQAFNNYQGSVNGGKGNPKVHWTDLTPWHTEPGLQDMGGGNKYSADGTHPLGWRAEQLGGIFATAITQQLMQAQIDELTLKLQQQEQLMAHKDASVERTAPTSNKHISILQDS